MKTMTAPNARRIASQLAQRRDNHVFLITEVGDDEIHREYIDRLTAALVYLNRRIEREDRAAWEARTVAFVIGGEEFSMADARRLFDKYHPGADWKRPVDAVVPYCDLFAFMEAVRFYQGCRPTAVPARSSVTDPGYRVTSPGYVC